MLKRSATQKIFLALCLVSAAIFAAACGKVATTGSGGGGSTNPTPVPSPTPSQIPFEVTITSLYDGAESTASTLEADCQTPIGTVPYSAGALNQICTNPLGTINSTVVIPEGRLYYSKLTFAVTVNANTSGCAMMTIQPYFYKAGNAAGFSAPWTGGTTVDCSASPIPAACFGGLAVDIAPSFPKYTGGVYFMTSAQTTGSATANSANSHTYGSNRFAVSNATAGQIAAGHLFASGGGDNLIANQFQGYKFYCTDIYDDTMFEFSMTLTDQDILGTYPNAAGEPAVRTTNEFPDWDPTSWQY